jgi:cytoskeletal protein CcmA (bactofilin family)
MVFRKESRADSFQRQISALRQQLGTDQEEDEFYDDAEPMPEAPAPAEGNPPVAARMPASPTPHASQPRGADAATGVIAAGSIWSGTLNTQGSLQIFGEVEGELVASNEIFVAEGARVNARIAAQVIIVAGMVDGTLECGGRLEVLPTGRVSGEVFAPTLVVHEGATVDGDLKMQAAEAAS